MVDGVEECDDANELDGDSCTNACTLAKCGDVVIGPGEDCDDGNLAPFDGCSELCSLEFCGDGVTAPDELCDDGNLDESDECTTLCQAPVCGDGIVSLGESCDLGIMNGEYGSGCNATCSGPAPACGDLVWDEPQEQCDGADKPFQVDCQPDCTAECNFGWEDCNEGLGDGCEKNLATDEANCGECDYMCPAGNPKCDVFLCHP